MTNDIYTLISDLAEVDSEIAMLNKQREELRNRISVLVEQEGGKVALPGVARAEIRSPSITRQYDKAQLDELCESLFQTGHGDVAAEIQACVRESMRAGGLVVVMERKQA